SLITGQNFSTNRPGEVFAKLVSSKGCVNYTDTVEIEVNPKPEKPLVITVDGKTEYCYDEQAILLVTGNFLPLQWNTIPPSVNDSIWPTESGTYIATVSNNFGCTNNSEPIEIIYRDSLEIPTIYNEKDTLIVDLDESHVFQWYGDGFRLLGQNNNFMVADADGIYQVEVTDAFGCTNISAPFNFNYAQATTGIQEFSNAGINLFPNPVKVGDVLKFRGVKEAATAVFYDGLGKEVLRTNEILEISTSVLSSGVYTVTLQTKSKILVGKLMVE
ncbi:MAG: T9SS type A sorting domain-containing protein, partial [Luteibaculum sp.]